MSQLTPFFATDTVLALLPPTISTHFDKAMQSNPSEWTNICWSTHYAPEETSPGDDPFSEGTNSRLEILRWKKISFLLLALKDHGRHMNSKYGGGFCGSSNVRPWLQGEKLSKAFEYATGILTVFHGIGVCQSILLLSVVLPILVL